MKDETGIKNIFLYSNKSSKVKLNINLSLTGSLYCSFLTQEK